MYHAIPCCPSYRQIFGLFLAVFLFFVVSQLSPTLYIRFYPDTTIEFTCFLFCTVFLSIIVPYIISTSKLQLSCPVCCAGSFSSLSTLSSHSSHTLSLSLCSHVHHFVPDFFCFVHKKRTTNKQTKQLVFACLVPLPFISARVSSL